MTDSTAKPRLTAPPGACDCHMHIYGPAERYPLADSRAFDPPQGDVPAYRALQARLGLERVVIVQPSAYGLDNRCTLDAMAAIGPSARGVVTLDRSVSGDTLQAMHAAGVRGIRFFMLMEGGAVPWEILEEMAQRVDPLGWHVQLQMDGRLLPEREVMLRRLPGTLVIDHNGTFRAPVGTDHPGFRSLLGLLERGRTWIKCSAPYMTSRADEPRYGDVAPIAKALIAAAPERIVWGSDWPHPLARPGPPDDAALLDLLLDWVEEEALRSRILADNPAELYGFGNAA